MMRVYFGYGTGKTKDGDDIGEDYARLAECAILIDATGLFGGAFVYKGLGGWNDGTADIFETGSTLVVDMPELDHEGIKAMASLIKEQLNQQAVHVAYHEIMAYDV
jgi:hypothetical protein